METTVNETNKTPQKILGLDIGISSTGWCLLKLDETAATGSLLDLGARTFPAPHDEQTKESHAKARGEARRTRHTLRRRKLRMRQIRSLLKTHNIADPEYIDAAYLHERPAELQVPAKAAKIEAGALTYRYDHNTQDPWKLRIKALHERLSNEELARVLCHLAKHRGFKSMKKGKDTNAILDTQTAELIDIDEEEKAAYEMVATTNNLIETYHKIRCAKTNVTPTETPSPTPAELIVNITDNPHPELLRLLKGETYETSRRRNRQGNHICIFTRELILTEALRILTKQRELGNDKLSDEFQIAYLQKLSHFNKMQDVLKLVAWCRHETNRYRSPRNAYSIELFNICALLNNIKFSNEPLTADEKQEVLKLLSERKEPTFGGIAKLLHRDIAELNYKAEKKDKLPNNFKGYHTLRIAISQLPDTGEQLWNAIDPQPAAATPPANAAKRIAALNLIAEAISYCKNPQSTLAYCRAKGECWQEVHRHTANTPSLITLLAELCQLPLAEGETIAETLGAELNNKIIIDKNQTRAPFMQNVSSAVRTEIGNVASVAPAAPNSASPTEKTWRQLLKIIAVEVDFSGFASLSITAADKLIPILQTEDCTYDKAVAEVYPNSADRLAGTANLLPPLDKHEKREITSPVVLRAIYRVREVYNHIVRQHGKPDIIRIELARELAHGKKQKSKIEQGQKKFQKAKTDRVTQFIEQFNREPRYDELLKFELFKEQDGVSLYSGREFSTDEALFHETEIDHIIPYSKCFDNTKNNKTLCFTDENREKSDKTPYYHVRTEDWDSFCSRIAVNKKIKPAKKDRLLMTRELNDEESEKFTRRNLTDTQYMSRFLKNYFEKHVDFGKERRDKVNVMAVKGGITARLRQLWGLKKNREEGDTHHALDAAIIASTSPSVLKRISDYERNREKNRLKSLRSQQKNISKEDLEKKFKRDMIGYAPKPWDTFREDLLAEKNKLTVSRWVHKIETGSAHKETLYSKQKPTATTAPGQLVHYVSLSNIKSHVDLGKTLLWQEVYPNTNDADAPPPPAKLELCRLLEERINEHKDKAFTQGFVWCWDKNTKRGEDLTDEYFKDFSAPKGVAPAVLDEQAQRQHEHRQQLRTTGATVIRRLRIAETLTTIPLSERGYAKQGDMLRIDIFGKENKRGTLNYYAVPLYTHHVWEKVIFSKACVQGKDETDWLVMDEPYSFQFSLHRDELVEIERAGVLYRGYYKQFGRATATITIAGHDRYTIHGTNFEADMLEIPSAELELQPLRDKEQTEALIGERTHKRSGKQGKSDTLLDASGNMTSIGIKTVKLFRKAQISPLGIISNPIWQPRQPPPYRTSYTAFTSAASRVFNIV